jgi:outer membrane protein assembly factor BamB
MKHKLVVLWVCLLVSMAADAARAQGQNGLITESQAQTYGLTRSWFARVHVDPAQGKVAAVVLQSGLILSQTDIGNVDAIDAETGRTLWSVHVGISRHITMPPGANGQYVAVTNGITLFVLERSTGGIVWQEKMGGTPSSGCILSDKYVFVPMDDGAIESYKLVRKNELDRAPVVRYGTPSADATPILAADRILWTTSKGDFYSDEIESATNRIQIRTRAPIRGAAAYWPPLVYLTSQDGGLYAVKASSGAQDWHFSAAAAISHQPVVNEGGVYAIADNGRMWKFDAATGQIQWQQDNMSKLLAVSKTRVYVADLVGRMNILDARSGARLGAMGIEHLPIRVVNTQTDRIYLGTRWGLLQCLHELQQSMPLAHAPAPPAEPGKKGAKPAAAGEAPAAMPAEPAGANPFGANQ